jgi:hypothetical protein
VAIYYVSTTGSDGAAGSLAAPWATIQKAANTMIAGDTVIVRDGTYTSSVTSGAVVDINTGGTAGNPITYQAENTWGAKIDGQSCLLDDGFDLQNANANYIRIIGFEIYGMAREAIVIFNGASNISILSNDIHSVGRRCTATNLGQNGVFIGGGTSNVVVEGNRIRDLGRFAEGENGCSPGNTFWQNHDHGIYLEEATDVTIQNNLFMNCKRGWCIQRFDGGGSVATRIRVHNNTFVGENPNRDGHIIMATASVDFRIENNLFYDPRASAVDFASATSQQGFIRNNLVFGGVLNTGTPASSMTSTGNVVNTDPLVLNAADNNYRLTSTSPARGAGLSLASVAVDFDGTSRASYDIGAFEFVAAAASSGGSRRWARSAMGSRFTVQPTATDRLGAS